MIGDIISKARKDKSIKKATISEKTEIHPGHLTHIEKEQRTPSHNALRAICDAIKLPYQPLMNTYDKELSDEQKEYKLTNYISASKIPAVSSIEDFVDCPLPAKNASLAIKITADDMLPTLKIDGYAYLEWNTIPTNKEMGLFIYNNHILIRRFILRRGEIILRADNKDYSDIIVDTSLPFTIIGKINHGR